MAYFSNMFTFTFVLGLTFFFGTECSNVTMPKWKDLECQVYMWCRERRLLKTFFLSLVPSIFSLSWPATGRTPGWSVRCTGAGSCRSTTSRSTTVWWDMDWRRRPWTGTGLMAMMWPTPECGHMLGITLRCHSSLRKSDVAARLKIRIAAVAMVTLLSFTLVITCSTGETTAIHHPVVLIFLFVKHGFEYSN